jgi:hypothetical protein
MPSANANSDAKGVSTFAVPVTRTIRGLATEIVLTGPDDASAAIHVRSAVVGPLLNDRPPYRNLPLVLRWLGESASAREQLQVAMWLAAVLPPRWLSRTIARGLADASPSLRDQSRRLLAWLPSARVGGPGGNGSGEGGRRSDGGGSMGHRRATREGAGGASVGTHRRRGASDEDAPIGLTTAHIRSLDTMRAQLR